MKLGIELVPNEPIDKLIEYAKLAESLNYTNLWVTDHYNNMDVYSILSIIALNTEKIFIGVGVTNLHTRHLLITASGIATLREISKGRSFLGIGPGDIKTLNSMGFKNPIKSFEMLKIGIPILKKLFNKNNISSTFGNCEILHAQLSFIKNESYIPIYIGAKGNKLLDLSSEIGDGVLINSSNVNEIKNIIKFLIPKIKKKYFEICVYTCFSVDVDKRVARSKAIPVIAHIISSLDDKSANKYNINSCLKNEISNCIQIKNYDRLNYLINDKLIDLFSISGDIEYCTQEIKKLYEIGVTQVIIGSPVGSNKKESIKIVANIIENIKTKK